MANIKKKPLKIVGATKDFDAMEKRIKDLEQQCEAFKTALESARDYAKQSASDASSLNARVNKINARVIKLEEFSIKDTRRIESLELSRDFTRSSLASMAAILNEKLHACWGGAVVVVAIGLLATSLVLLHHIYSS